MYVCLYAHTFMERKGIQLNFSLDQIIDNNYEFKTAKLWLLRESLMKRNALSLRHP